jgi:hypothetical protein
MMGKQHISGTPGLHAEVVVSRNLCSNFGLCSGDPRRIFVLQVVC